MKDMSKGLENAITEFRRLWKDVPFDCSVFITYNSQTNELRNGWNFDGHPNDWGKRELCSMAQQITSTTAEIMKEDVNVPEGRETITRKAIKPIVAKIALYKDDSIDRRVLLFGLGIYTPRPIWFQVYRPSYFSFGVWSSVEDKSNGGKYWRVVFNCLLFNFMISRDI